MKLHAVRVFVDEFDVARQFYRDTLGLAELWALEDVKAAGYETGPGQLIVEEAAPGHAHRVDMARFVGVSLWVEDLPTIHGALKAQGVEFVQAPHVQPWGGLLAHFRDPAGNVLSLLGSP